MSKEIDHGRLLDQGGLPAPMTGLSALVEQGSATADTPKSTVSKSASFSGAWTVDISFPSNPEIPPHRGMFACTADGILITASTHGANPGIGTWRPMFLVKFSFMLRHHTFDPSGLWTGVLDIEHTGVLTTPNSFRASGTTTFYDTNGKQTGVLESATAGTRF